MSEPRAVVSRAYTRKDQQESLILIEVLSWSTGWLAVGDGTPARP